jgi:cytochrome P450
MTQRLNLLAPEVRENPYPFYAKLRRDAPVTQVEPNGIWVISRAEDIIACAKNTQVFSSEGMRLAAEPPWLGRYSPIADSIILADPPRHGRLRGLMSRAFTNAMLSRVESYARDVSERLIIEMLEKKEVDFMSSFSIRLPVNVLALLMGIDPSKEKDYARWAYYMIRAGATTPDQHEQLAATRLALDEMVAYLTGVLEARRSKPADDLVTELVNARVEGEALTDKEILAFLCLLLMAGVETTQGLLTHMAMVLAQQPQWFERLRGATSDTLYKQFVEEVLRTEPPIQLTLRLTTQELEVGGVKIPPHSMVALLWASGLRDEKVVSDPETFHPERGAQANMAFGYGAHFCLGAPLARMEGRIALELIVSMCQKFDLLEPVEWSMSLVGRAPERLKLRISPIT